MLSPKCLVKYVKMAESPDITRVGTMFIGRLLRRANSE
jgi:hypothetical protein